MPPLAFRVGSPRLLRVAFGTPVLSSVELDGRLQPPRSGYVRFATNGKSLDVALSGEATIPTADSGWETLPRAQRVDMTVWRSGKPLRQDVPIVMDVLGQAIRTENGADVDMEWRALERMWRPAGGVQPPPVTISGPVSHTNHKWVITDLQPDEGSVKRISERLVRVRATVALMQYVTPDLGDYADPDSAKRRALVDRPRFETSKEGDTMRIIAKRRLKKGSRWTQIRDMYPGSLAPAWTRGPDKVIPTATRVQIPNG